jgi:hypothetical protein
MAHLLADIMAAAATAAEDPDRGRPMWRANERQCRLTGPGTMVISGGESVLVTQLEGVDLEVLK